MEMNKGSCLCKSVTYEINSAPYDCCFCHCSICRKLTGSSYGTYGTVANGHFRWTAGKELLDTYAQSEQMRRLFCTACGSYMITLYALEPENVYLSLGCLENDGDVKIAYQQFVGSKASWTILDHSITQHHKWPE
ncbi:MAG: hypothetical protein ACI9UN_004518 [Granulosicoccus sp.]|jgi:hypothetical protein